MQVSMQQILYVLMLSFNMNCVCMTAKNKYNKYFITPEMKLCKCFLVVFWWLLLMMLCFTGVTMIDKPL